MSSIAATSAGRALASAQPYPWPFHGSFDAGRSALVACLDVRWRVGGPASDDSDARLLELAGALRGHGGLVVVITSTPLQPELAFAACEMVRFSGGIFGAFADTASVIYFLADAPTTRS